MKCKVFAVALAGFVAYNNVVIVWELNKKDSKVCPKCAYTRIGVGTVLAGAALVMAFGGVRGQN
jgi:hypothetical protein